MFDSAVLSELAADGAAVAPGLLTQAQCAEVAAWYDEPERFRSKVTMARHGFGRGEYQYFADPLPGLVTQLRTEAYAALVELANRWTPGAPYPPSHEEYRSRCRTAGQTRPTPLLLRYAAGDYNCLHQDLYGDLVFPIQLAILLSAPGRDFTGGEFVLTEQRPRMQSRAMVMPLQQGDGVVLAVHHRPVEGSRGTYKVNLRHGVSKVRSGRRHTLGIILHDAR